MTTAQVERRRQSQTNNGAKEKHPHDDYIGPGIRWNCQPSVEHLCENDESGCSQCVRENIAGFVVQVQQRFDAAAVGVCDSAVSAEEVDIVYVPIETEDDGEYIS